MTTAHVVEGFRKGRKLFEGRGYESIRSAVAFVEGETAPGMKRLALWISEPPPASGPDAAVCVPLRLLCEFEARLGRPRSSPAGSDLGLIDSVPAPIARPRGTTCAVPWRRR